MYFLRQVAAFALVANSDARPRIPNADQAPRTRDHGSSDADPRILEHGTAHRATSRCPIIRFAGPIGFNCLFIIQME